MGRKEADKVEVAEPAGEGPDPGVPRPLRARAGHVDRRRHDPDPRRGGAGPRRCGVPRVRRARPLRRALRQDPSVRRRYPGPRGTLSRVGDRSCPAHSRGRDDDAARPPRHGRVLRRAVSRSCSACCRRRARRSSACLRHSPHRRARAHWELLLRARAVENLCYVLAPAQSGMHDNGRETYGDSMIVDPWGHVARARRRAPGPGLAVAEIDRTLQHELRGRFPALSHRKFQVTEARRELDEADDAAMPTDPSPARSAHRICLQPQTRASAARPGAPAPSSRRRGSTRTASRACSATSWATASTTPTCTSSSCREESWSLEDSIVKDGSHSIEQGVGVRALAGEKTGFAYSDEIVLPALTEATQAARAIARSGANSSMQAWHASDGSSAVSAARSARRVERCRESAAARARRRRGASHRSARDASDGEPVRLRTKSCS